MILTIDAVRRIDSSETHILPPWEVDRYGLFSPIDMIRFHAGLYGVIMRDLAGQIGLCISVISDGDGNENLSEVQPVQEGIVKCLRLLLDAPEIILSRTMSQKIEALAERASAGTNFQIIQAEALLKELQNDLLREVSSPYFLMIPAEMRGLYEQRKPPFGQNVTERFPDANYDIAAAGRCIALDEWTAAVFHLMRVLEVGLTELERVLNLPALPVDQWHKRIKDIEDEIQRLRNLPRDQRPSDDKVTFYSEAAVSFRHFKDAWRNHVSHVRGRYDERDARSVWNHVGLFMQALAENLA